MARKLSCSIVVGAVLLWAVSTSAGGLYVQELATPRNGTAQAGQAAYAYDAATAFYNPAGMSRLERPQWLIGFQPFITDIEFDLKGTTTFDGGEGGQQGGVVPTVGAYYAHPLNDRWALGASLVGISGGALNPDNDWAGRFYITNLSLMVLALNPTVSFRVNDWLSVGAGVAVNYGTLDFDLKLPRAGNFIDRDALRGSVEQKIAQSPLPGLIDRINQLPPPIRDPILERIDEALAPARAQLQGVSELLEPGPEGKVEMSNVYDFAFNYNLGILIEPCERWRFGVTYRSEVDFKMHGDFNVSSLPPIYQALGLTDGGVEAEIKLPHLVRASVYHQLTDTVALMANVGWENWSSMEFTPITGPPGEGIQVPRNWKDTWHFALGTEWRVAPRWLLQTGAAYDTSPVRDRFQNLPDQPSDRQWRFSVGVVHDWSERVKIGLNYTFIDFGHSPIDTSNAFGRLAGDYQSFDGHAIALSVGF